MQRRDFLAGAAALAAYSRLNGTAEALKNTDVALLGGAGLPPSPLTYQSVWKDSFASLSLRTGGPTPAGLAAGKGIWADAGLYYNPGTGINTRGIASFGYGWFVDHSFNWSAVDPNYPPLGQLDVQSDGLHLIGGSNFPLIRNTLTPINLVSAPPANASAWFNGLGGTYTTGTAVDGLPVPAVIASGGSTGARREYFASGNVVGAGAVVTNLIKYNLGTSNALYGQVDLNGNTSTFHVSGGVFTQDTFGAGTAANVSIATVGSHVELSFQFTVASTGFLDIGVGPFSATPGQTVIVYDFQVQVPPYLSALVSSLYSASIKPPFYRETVFTVPGGANNWSAAWGLGIDTSDGQFEVDDLETFDPSYPSDQINSALHTPQGSASNLYRTGTSLAGRQITLGVQVTDQAVVIYNGGRNGTVAGVMRMPAGVHTQKFNYSIFDQDVGFPWLIYPVGITTPSSMIIRSIEYFAPASNTTGVFPPAPPLPVVTWGASFPAGVIPDTTANGTTVGTLSGASSYSILGYSGLTVSGSNLVTSGTLSGGSFGFYLSSLDGSGNPGIAPKLTATITSTLIIDEQFTTATYFPGPIASDLVDTRASSKTLINASGNFVTVGSNVLPISNTGMLPEPVATNLFLQSGSAANASWANGAITTGTGDTGPSGATTVKLTPTVASALHYLQQGPFTVSNAATVTHWRVVKANGYNWVALSVFDTAHHAAWFNLSTGAIGTVQTGVSALTPIALSNGYWLIGIKYTITGTAVYGTLWPATANGANFNVIWSGDGVSSVNQDVAQIEVGGSPTSYIPTTTASVTRAADSIVIQHTGIGRVVITFDDSSQQTISGINKSVQYTIPDNLNRALITRLQGYAS